MARPPPTTPPPPTPTRPPPLSSILVSDLHFGGDGDLRLCDFADEFVAFLRDLATRDEDAELVIAGDTFGFWETTTVSGVAKLDKIIADHQPVFDQLRWTGETVAITLMVGNHDYDLACDPGFAPKLAAYNIRLDTSVSLSRELAGRKVWIEHGQQSDPFNASPDYGNLYALPVGYFITETVVASASRLAELGRGNWLKDIRSVATEQIPDWILSNYFCREMAWVIRAVLRSSCSSSVFTLGAVLDGGAPRRGHRRQQHFPQQPDLSFAGLRRQHPAPRDPREHGDPVLHAGRGDPRHVRPPRHQEHAPPVSDHRRRGELPRRRTRTRPISTGRARSLPSIPRPRSISSAIPTTPSSSASPMAG